MKATQELLPGTDVQARGLRLDVIDRARLEEVRKSTELGANPFDHIPLVLVSIDFLKQDRILDQLDRSAYDAIVIDEAHHCTDLGAAGDREDSQRRKLAQVLARRYNDVLSFIALLKRSVSTVAACRGTLQVVAERFQKILTEGAEGQESKRQRERLTVVPNALGAVTASDAVSERLLKGLLEEDRRLFQYDGRLFDFTGAEENSGADEATRELLEEIDRCLKGFERASRTHNWLGDAGLNADERLQWEADGVLCLYRRRRQDITARLELGTPEIIPLGVLMD